MVSLDNARCKPRPRPCSCLQCFWRNPKSPPVSVLERWLLEPLRCASGPLGFLNGAEDGPKKNSGCSFQGNIVCKAIYLDFILHNQWVFGNSFFPCYGRIIVNRWCIMRQTWTLRGATARKSVKLEKGKEKERLYLTRLLCPLLEFYLICALLLNLLRKSVI